MAFTKETVEYVAHLARIELQEKEIEKLTHQLQDIVHYIDALATLDVSAVNPTSHILALSSVLRNDEPRPSLALDKALANAPRKEGNFFVVPKVLE